MSDHEQKKKEIQERIRILAERGCSNPVVQCIKEQVALLKLDVAQREADQQLGISQGCKDMKVNWSDLAETFGAGAIGRITDVSE